MDQFRPAPPSILKQIWVSPVFLVGLTLAVVMASVVFIRQKQSEEIESRAELLRAGPVIVEPTSASTEAVAQASPPEAALPPEDAVAPPPAQEANALNTASTSPTAANVAAKAFASSLPADSPAPEPSARPEGRSAATATKKVNVTATYATVLKPALAQIEADSQATGQYTDFGEFRAGALPEVRAHLRSARVLQRVNKAFEAKLNSQKWFVGTKGGDEQEMGMTVLMTLENAPEGHTKGEVEMLRSLPDNDEAEITKKSYPISSFDLPPRFGWMIVITDLPRKLNLGADAFGTDGFLSLFRVGDYNNANAEFTLFLDFDSSTP